MTQLEVAGDSWYRLQEAIEARKAATTTTEFVRAYAREKALRALEEKRLDTTHRKKLEKKGHAMKGGRFPIVHGGDLDNAIKAFGRGNPPDKAAIKAHITKRAKELGQTHKLPSHW